MSVKTSLFVAAVFLAFASGAAPATMMAMQGHRRVLVASAPRPIDPRVIRQRRIFAKWSRGAADRDLSLVEVSASQVNGASDAASALRRRYHLSPETFQVLLIGKDGKIALRSARPVDAANLQSTIDAMPMRRAGER